jgi:succinate-acetate transporter protein
VNISYEARVLEDNGVVLDVREGDIGGTRAFASGGVVQSYGLFWLEIAYIFEVNISNSRK